MSFFYDSLLQVTACEMSLALCLQAMSAAIMQNSNKHNSHMHQRHCVADHHPKTTSSQVCSMLNTTCVRFSSWKMFTDGFVGYLCEQRRLSVSSTTCLSHRPWLEQKKTVHSDMTLQQQEAVQNLTPPPTPTPPCSKCSHTITVGFASFHSLKMVLFLDFLLKTFLPCTARDKHHVPHTSCV